MLLQPRVVGRALDGEVERDLDAELAAARDQRARSPRSVPSSGSIASWPPSSEPIAHGLPGIARAGDERVVAALAVRRADRVDRRQVDDVEAELGEVGQHLGRRPRSRPTSAGRARTRRRSARGSRSASTGEARRRSVYSRAVRRRSRASALLDGRCLAAPKQDAPPRRARSRGPPARRRPCAAARRGTRRSGRPRRRPELPAAGRVELEVAEPAVVAGVVHQRLAPAPLALAARSGRAAPRTRGRRGRSSRATSSRSPAVALTG